jgi:hypothetical protein
MGSFAPDMIIPASGQSNHDCNIRLQQDNFIIFLIIMDDWFLVDEG